MQTISNTSFEGERPLFKHSNMKLDHVVIHPGESALKECKNIYSVNCEFEGKYPFWHNENTKIEKCTFTDGARAAIWYCKNMEMNDSKIEAPKMFREIDGLTASNLTFSNAQETFWYCKNLKLSNISFEKADYIFINNRNLRMNNIVMNGNYSFQYCKDVEIRNSKLNSKDAFWNSENVTIYDSIIKGEYLGWHSKNLKLVNCQISGTQPFCYCHNLILENCTMDSSCDLCFEYSTVRADVHSTIKSIKNPSSGEIIADNYEEIIFDENVKEPNNCVISKREDESNKLKRFPNNEKVQLNNEKDQFSTLC
ncbi:hypothetical protein M9Y10_017652 [Tritrichomonas musculus]|uniref:DUF3737 family protein n=1 Tax=Tritrichomonas musculus TaxID=1915356 RepID=A0ABR2HU58_9EUKA